MTATYKSRIYLYMRLTYLNGLVWFGFMGYVYIDGSFPTLSWWFICLKAYQPLRVIWCQGYPCRRTVVVLLNP